MATRTPKRTGSPSWFTVAWISVVVLAVGTALICFVVMLGKMPAERQLPPNAGRADEAEKWALVYLKQHVNFPAEAEIDVDGKRFQEEGYWIVAGSMTAKNAFGVRSKYRWTVSVKLALDSDGKTYSWNKLAVLLDEDRE